jgi:hypothetical protein
VRFGPWVFGLKAAGEMLHVCADGGFYVFDISDPVSPLAADSFRVGAQSVVDVAVSGTRAHVSIPYSPLCIIDCANPDSLKLVGQIHGDHDQYVFASAARDSILYAGVNGRGIVAYGVEDPSNPYVIGEDTNWAVLNFRDVVLRGDELVVASWGCVYVLDIGDPTNMRKLGRYQPIGGLADIAVDSSYIYAASGDAGLSILELLPSGIEETMNDERVTMNLGPTIVRGVLEIGPQFTADSRQLALYDANGRRVMTIPHSALRSSQSVDVSRLAPGVCFVRSAESGGRSAVRKVVVQR